MTKCVSGKLIKKAKSFEIGAALWDKFDLRAAANWTVKDEIFESKKKLAW